MDAIDERVDLKLRNLPGFPKSRTSPRSRKAEELAELIGSVSDDHKRFCLVSYYATSTLFLTHASHSLSSVTTSKLRLGTLRMKILELRQRTRT